MKRKARLAAVITLMLLISTFFGGCGSMFKNRKYQDLTLKSFSITSGGGMEGGRSELRAYRDDSNGVVTVYRSDSQTWYQNPEAELFVVDSALLDEIKSVIIEDKLYKAADAPLSNMQVLDAPTTSYGIFFSEGEYLSYSSSQKLSSKVFDAHKKITAIINEYCEKGTEYPTVYVETDGEYTFWKEQDGITVDCSNGGAFTLSLNIYNGGGETELKGDVTLSKMDGDKAVYTEVLEENRAVSLYAQSEDYITLAFPIDRYPQEGVYKLEYAGYEAAFEMRVYSVS